MRKFLTIGTLGLIGFLSACVHVDADFDLELNAPPPPEWSLVIHGGAGVITREAMTPETEAAYTAALTELVSTGSGMLQDGAAGLDVVETLINSMEDNPLFNAGRGAVMTEDGGFSLDSSIMVGDTLDSGAVAGLSNVRHPISAARKAMENSPHVMLAGEGADQFAAQEGLEIVDPSWFYTQRRWESLLRALERRGVEAPPNRYGPKDDSARFAFPDDRKFGTVGVVAMDRSGNIVAGTSTGGTTAKRWGRVGDSPVIGAGTYAKSDVCGVSSTGTGEYFIRLSIAYAICSRIELLGEDAQTAADYVIHTSLSDLGGDGGVIVLGPQGQPAWSFNTEGMYRGYATSGGEQVVEIYEYNKGAFD
ncbi:MAG: isoaspartyl peptidase/L-asparaginase [Ponticaulis sp.]|nr:isoaspartyl peptidase/L-asparaginase [Ponticaulis sp.]